MNIQIARRMIGAETVKLRRNRGLMAFALLLSVVMIAIVFGYSAIQHSSNPAQNDPAGGLHGFEQAGKMLALFFGMLVAALIGGEAGTSDLSSGVFRDLVATGRSRIALFAVRAPAALLVTLAFTGAAYALAIAGTFAFADGLPTPTAGQILQTAGWIVVANAAVVALAVGVGSVTGSRAVTLTGVIGWQAVATQLLLNVTSLGSARDALLTPALDQLRPLGSPIQGITMATGVAVLVIAAWALIATGLGVWRTRTRDA